MVLLTIHASSLIHLPSLSSVNQLNRYFQILHLMRPSSWQHLTLLRWECYAECKFCIPQSSLPWRIRRSINDAVLLPSTHQGNANPRPWVPGAQGHSDLSFTSTKPGKRHTRKSTSSSTRMSKQLSSIKIYLLRPRSTRTIAKRRKNTFSCVKWPKKHEIRTP
jgi:hypothetical protein